METKTNPPVAVMRACPLHLGHEAIIQRMVRDAGDTTPIVLLGSSNRAPSFRYMFTYKERYELVTTRFGDIQVAGLPDFPDDDEQWLFNLNSTLELAHTTVEDVTFYGGCQEDLQWFVERDLKTHITNRFAGTESPIISATQVRDALLEHRSLDGLVHESIQPRVQELFDTAIARLKSL